MRHKSSGFLKNVAIAVLLCVPSIAHAQAYLGSTLEDFAVLGSTPDVTNTGSSVITGHVGVSPAASITGFPPGIINPPYTQHTGDATALTAQTELTAAYTSMNGLPCADLTGVDLGTLSLVPGTYCYSSSAQLTGTLTLNAQGDPNAVWVFRIGSSLTTASGSSVVFINGSNANACGVQWQVGSSATIGTGTNFAGNILAQASITMNTGANLLGRALARVGTVTLDNNVISFAGCNPLVVPPPFPPPGPPPVPVPTLPEWAIIALMALLGLAGFAAMRKRAV